MIVSTKKPRSRPNMLHLSAKGGTGRGTLSDLLSSTAFTKHQKRRIDLSDTDPANPILRRNLKMLRKRRRRLLDSMFARGARA